MSYREQIALELTARDKTALAVKSLENRMVNLSGTMLRIAGIGGGIYAFKRGIESVIKSASDAQEISSKFDVVFKQLSSGARKWAENFGNDVGRATQDVEKWMAGLQDTFVPLGLARDKAYELDKSLVSLAVDVASFNNAADTDVIRDFTSALVGNHEVVRKYGIMISENAIKQAALNKGWNKSYKELSDLEKVMLRFEIIQGATTDAQGDAIRTADSYANQVKRLNANFTEMKTNLGENIIPLMTKLVGKMSDGVTGVNYLVDSIKAFNEVRQGSDKVFNDSIRRQIKELEELKAKPVYTGVTDLFKDTRNISISEIDKKINALKEQLILEKQVKAEAAGSDGANALDTSYMTSARATNEKALSQLKALKKPLEELRTVRDEQRKVASQRAQITARMYEDMGVHDKRYKDAQIALLNIQKKDYQDILNDKTTSYEQFIKNQALLDDWYAARKKQLDENAVDQWSNQFLNGNIFDRLSENYASALDDMGSKLTEWMKTGKMDWQGWTNSLLTSWMDTLNKMAVAQIQQSIISPLIGAAAGLIGGAITGGLGSLFGGGASGATVGLAESGIGTSTMSE